MEESTMYSYLKKSVDFNSDVDQKSEESGWTAYFEGFLNEQKGKQYSDDLCNSSFVGSTSIVSDAASFVVEYQKVPNKDQAVACSTITSLPKFSKKLNFKKTRTKEISYDDSLEDTASSPVNSPKIMQVKGGNPDRRSDLQTDERRTDGVVFEGKNSNCTYLRKRGLCLVPMSMLVNYLG